METSSSEHLFYCQYYEALVVFQNNHIFTSCSKCRPSTNWKLYNLVQKRKKIRSIDVHYNIIKTYRKMTKRLDAYSLRYTSYTLV
jgi:hypothetical protein